MANRANATFRGSARNMSRENRTFNSSFSPKNWTFNANSSRIRRPRPSKVNVRLELAREKPVGSNPELVRLLYYKKLFIQSNASAEELQALDNLIERFRNKSTKQGEDCFDDDLEKKPSSAVESLGNMMNALGLTVENVEPDKDVDVAVPELEKRINKQLNLSTESSDEKLEKAVPAPQTFVYRKLRLPAHLQPKTTASNVENESQSDSTECAAINYRSPSGVLGHYLRNLLPNCDSGSRNSNATLDDDFDVLTTKMENYHITPLNERKPTECICNRKVRETRCMSCDEVMDGRVFRRCQYHPKAVFSEDNFYCMKCCADITELLEIAET